ncbi:hypothetical protein XENOCAPTIV_002647, partial [Xenoophorus captivus]
DLTAVTAWLSCEAGRWSDGRYGGGMFVESACTHTHMQRYIFMDENTNWLALFNPLSGGARVTTTASWKDNHAHIAQAFPRGRGGSKGAEK